MTEDDVNRLLEQSMLRWAGALARRYSGTAALWQRPFAHRQPGAAVDTASVWFTAYPAATLTRRGDSVLCALGDERLWRLFSTMGIDAMHTGPLKLAGGLTPEGTTPSVDGHFDRISFAIDPLFGSEEEYRRMVATARACGGTIIADIIPGHTGKGADFRLAELAVGEYPGLYHLIEIPRVDWELLPAVPAGVDAANLAPSAVAELTAKGHIVGELARVIFYDPGIKESNWSATGVVPGVDGIERRWVYLHYFKEGQPALNWSDPSFAAPRLVIGDCLHALGELGVGMVRLDANGFLGVERGPSGGPAVSEGHLLSIAANQLIAGMVRKLGGHSFQELNLALDDLRAMSIGGADLSYDFITRPACHHALATGDARFLRLMLGLQPEYDIDPGSLIHALQNHDELTQELVHFARAHRDDPFCLDGESLTGAELRQRVCAELDAKLLAPAAPYNLKTTNGIACTMASAAAAVLGLSDLSEVSAPQRERIADLHLLLAFFNAMQPGVFALSGWDLVGALPLPRSAVSEWMADGDTRWIQRGAYDLFGDTGAERAPSGLPPAPVLYGAVPAQLADPGSFASRLQRILRVRRRHQIARARRLGLPEVSAHALVVMVHELPTGAGMQVTALNFGSEPVEEQVQIEASGAALDLMDTNRAAVFSTRRGLTVALTGYEARAFLIARG